MKFTINIEGNTQHDLISALDDVRAQIRAGHEVGCVVRNDNRWEFHIGGAIKADSVMWPVETPEQIRDRLLPVVHSYAAAEGLSGLGKVQAALRFGAQAGIESAAPREAGA